MFVHRGIASSSFWKILNMHILILNIHILITYTISLQYLAGCKPTRCWKIWSYFLTYFFSNRFYNKHRKSNNGDSFGEQHLTDVILFIVVDRVNNKFINLSWCRILWELVGKKRGKECYEWNICLPASNIVWPCRTLFSVTITAYLFIILVDIWKVITCHLMH